MGYLSSPTAQLFGALASFLVGAVFLGLSRVHRSEKTRKAFVLLGVGFGCQGVRHTFLLLGVLGIPFLYKMAGFFHIGWMLFACLGVFAYVGTTAYRQVIWIVAALLVILRIAGLGAHTPVPLLAIPGQLAGATLWCAVAIYFWRRNRELHSRLLAILPVLALAYAFNAASYPFTVNTRYEPYGHVMAPFLTFVIGIGLIVTALLDEQQQLLHEMEERRQAEDGLKRSEEKYRFVFDNANDAIFLHDGEGRIITANNLAVERLGYTREELMSMRADQIDSPEERKCTAQRIATLMESGRLRFETAHQCKDGSLILTEVSSRRIVWDGKPAVMSICRDVTEQKRIAGELRESEERYRTAIENSNDGVAMIKKGCFLYVNRKLLDIFGFDNVGQVLGQSVASTVHPDDRERVVNMAGRGRLTKDGPHSYEFKGIRTNGAVIFLEVSSTTTSYKGEPVTLAYLRDVTARKHLEEQLRQSRNLESIGTLAGGIAHDFNNLLMALAGNIFLAKMHLSPNDEAFRFLAEAESISIGGADLARRLITFAKGGVPVRSVISINELIRDSSDAVLADSNINIRAEYFLSDNLLPVKADEAMLKQVVHNIVQNAKEAMPRGGTIKVTSANIALTSEDMPPLPPGDYVKFTVEDEGTGIKEDDFPKIFDPYFTTKGMGAVKGMGLGLAVAYSIIKRHNGLIRVESVPGKSATVHVYLPAYKRENKIA